MPTGFTATWKDLDAEAARAAPKAGAEDIVRTLVGQTPLTEVHLGVQVRSGLRCLLIRLPDGRHPGVPTLPSWTGMRPTVLKGDELPVPRRFLVLRQEPGSPSDIFESVISDVSDAILGAPDSPPLSIARYRLERWKEFFSEVGVMGLGKEAQLGLFGELWVLSEHILPKLGPVSGIPAWVGPMHANHDFERSARALEIKSSVAKQHHKVHISNERQLDGHGLYKLFLLALSFTALEDGGITLPQITADLRRQLSGSPTELGLFNDRLMQAGYIDAQAGIYSTGYALREIRAYRVAEGFPRLTEKDLPEGVGDLTYTVVLSACEAFRLDSNLAIADFAGVP